MILILKSDANVPHWYEGFCNNLEQGIRMAGDTSDVVISYDKNKVNELNRGDAVVVTYYKDLLLPEIVNARCKVVFHHQGSGACPYMEFIDREAEVAQLAQVNLHTFSLPTEELLVKERYNLKHTVTIGFPLNFDDYIPYQGKEKQNKIVINGHITPGKQFYLATYLLKDLLKEYEIVFSVIEREKGVSGKWSSFYHLKSFEDMGFKFVFNFPTQHGFYELLSTASHVFSCSLADTISLGIAEGLLCGCYAVVPAITRYWPNISDYVWPGYVPFDKTSVFNYIENRPVQTFRREWFDAKRVGERLLDKL